MRTIVIQTITATLGTIGFALLSNVRKERIFSVGVGGFLAWIIYLIADHYTDSIMVSNFISVFFISIYAELMARILKAPATVFLIPSIIPLLPGAMLYYSMRAIWNNDMAKFRYFGYIAAAGVFGIALGIVLGYFVFSQMQKIVLYSRYYYFRKHRKCRK